MPKRFTDTCLWEEDWFIDLPRAYQFFWLFIKDNCDHAGIWRPNLAKFSRLYRNKIHLKEAVERINADKERVVVLANGRLLLTGFIPFQYGTSLNLNSRMHFSVYQLLLSNGVNLGSIRPQLEVIDRVKDKDKDSSSEERKEGECEGRKGEEKKRRIRAAFIPPFPDDVTNYANSIGFNLNGAAFVDHYESKGWVVGKAPMKDWQAAVRTWHRNGYNSQKAEKPREVIR